MGSEQARIPTTTTPYMRTPDKHAPTIKTSPVSFSPMISTAIATAGVFSPLKRKRDETPWRYQPPPPPEDDEDTDGELPPTAGDDGEVVGSRQASPRSRKLARQLEELSIRVPPPIFVDLDTDGDRVMAVKKVRRSMEGIATATATSAVIMEDLYGQGMGDHDEAMDADGHSNGKRVAGGDVSARSVEDNGVDAVERPPLPSPVEIEPAITVGPGGGDEMEEAEEDTRSPSSSSSSSNNNNSHKRRVRLRSPPLSRTETDMGGGGDGAAADEAEAEDVDVGQQGIGYRPTPTQRYVRSQKRMQQIKEYKARISREAREKRSESRRRRRSFPEQWRGSEVVMDAEGAEEGVGGKGKAEEGRKKVQFKIDA